MRSPWLLIVLVAAIIYVALVLASPEREQPVQDFIPATCCPAVEVDG